MVHRILLGSAGLTAFVHGVAWACSCRHSGGGIFGTEAVEAFDLAVFGEVVSVGTDLGCNDTAFGPSKNVRVKVIDGFVGARDGETVIVHTPSSEAACGVEFHRGETWLILTMEDRLVSLCGASHMTEEDDPTIVALREAYAR